MMVDDDRIVDRGPFNDDDPQWPQDHDEILACLHVFHQAPDDATREEIRRRCAERLAEMREPERQRREAEDAFRTSYARFRSLPEHPFDRDCEYLKDPQGCYYCCAACNYDRHICHFCGENTDHHGYTLNWKELRRERHWLSDCRPDLVEHEPGPLCTWPYRLDPNNPQYDPPNSCYAYQDRATNEWGTEHRHFYSDGRTS